MGSKSVADACSIICLLAPSIVLQSCGFFSPFWIKHNATSTCYRGVIYNVGCPDNVEGLGAAVLWLQMTSFVIIALAVLATTYCICCNSDDDNEEAGCFTVLGGCMFCLYPIAGILSFFGCMAVNFGDHSKGWAFYLCLTASCYIILQTTLCYCALWMHAKINNDDGKSGQEVTQYGTINNRESLDVIQRIENHHHYHIYMKNVIFKDTIFNV